jgi:hypothetical protein
MMTIAMKTMAIASDSLPIKIFLRANGAQTIALVAK